MKQGGSSGMWDRPKEKRNIFFFFFLGIVRRNAVIWWRQSDRAGRKNPELWKVEKLRQTIFFPLTPNFGAVISTAS